MKKAILFIASGILCYGIATATPPDPFGWKFKYCAEMRKGKLTVLNEGKPITTDVMLDNGTKIMMDGTVLMQDGTKRALTDGECVEKDGSILMREQMKKEKSVKKDSLK
jgi:hypothetical protein